MLLMIRALFNLLVRSDALRQTVLPTSADTVAAAAIALTANAGAWTWGLWAEIVSAANNGADRQITGFTLELPVFGIASAQGEVQISTGAGGAEADPPSIGTFPVVAASYTLPKPIRVPAGTRLAARLRTSSAAADTLAIKLLTLTGF